MKVAPPPRTLAPKTAPTVSVIEIRDPTAVGEGIEVIRQDAIQLTSKPLRARRVAVRLGSCVLVFQSTNRPMRTRSVLRDGLAAFVTFGPRAAATVNGMPVGPGRILAGAAGIDAEFVVAAGYESVSFLVPPDEIRAHLAGRRRDDPCFIPQGVELLQAGPAAVSRLHQWGRRLADTAARRPEVFEVPQTKSAAQAELLEMLLEVLGPAAAVPFKSSHLTRRAHHRVVRIAEDYALAHIGERLHVTGLCEAAAVSERTLQYAFKEVMGMTPVAFLTRLRLHRVRQALRAATPRSATVTAQAMRWGFWHFGDFSRAYKRCFGELPSVTLRR